MALEVTNLEGNEVADDYIRSSVPQSRWSDTWNVFKSNFLKLVLINVLVLITFAPAIAILFFRSEYYLKSLGRLYPFNSSILFPYYPDVTGLAERLTLSADILFYAALIVAGFIASVGIAGASYSIRKLINTHGEFSLKSFFHGVKVNYFNTVFPVSVFLLFMYATFLIGDQMDYALAFGSAAGEITAYVFIIIATVLVGIFFAWIFAVGTTYKVKFTQLFKNSFVLCIGSILKTLFMAGFSLIPVWLLMIGGIVRYVAYGVFIFIGFSFIILCWTAFTQSVFDAYINPQLKVAEEEKKAARTQEEVVADEKQRARELLAAGKSELISRPIMPIAAEAAVANVGKTFTRNDISAVAAGREKLNGDVAAYEAAHINDTVYVEYNRLFAEREKALSDEPGKKGKKKKKISVDNLLK